VTPDTESVGVFAKTETGTPPAAMLDVDPLAGLRTNADGPPTAVGASATPRNSVPAGAVATDVGSLMVPMPAAPVSSAFHSAFVVVTARLTLPPLWSATRPVMPGRSIDCASDQVVPLNLYFSSAPPRVEELAR
jgi:hypothetical protein